MSCIRKTIAFYFVVGACAASIGRAQVIGTFPRSTVSKGSALVYVGTFTDTPARSKGIYLFQLLPGKRKGEAGMVPLGVAAETPSPAFLQLDAKRHLLFCANETDSFNGKPGGAVSAFSVEPMFGRLKLINQQPSMGSRPCHIVLDQTGRNLLVANYNSGSIAVLPVSADGRIGEATCVIEDTGKGVDPDRQAGPHAHCVALSPDNRFAFVCDLGIDKVMAFKFDAEHGKLIPNDPPFVQIKAGAGPRHMAFRPDGKFAYVINELNSTIVVFAYDEKTGALKELQTVSSLPANFKGTNKAAEIAVVPSGKFLFASNRGDNSIATFAIDSMNGTLTWVEAQSTHGKTPRYFGIGPEAKYLAVCNQDSDAMGMYRLDDATGHLEQSGGSIAVPAPVCAVFLQADAGQ